MAERSHSDAFAEILRDQGAHDVYERSYQWLYTLKSKSGFRFVDGKEQSLIATSCGILILEGLRKLQNIPQEERLAWGSYLQGCQNADSGLFVDPLSDGLPGEGTHRDASYLTHQMTYFVLQAMDALGTKAPYSLRFMDRFSSAKAITVWLEDLDWSNAWLQSDKIMFVLAFLIYRAEVEQDRSAAALFHSVLNWLDLVQNAKTGLWGTHQGASLVNTVAAAYRLIPFYMYVHRPVIRATHIIDVILASLQLPDGPFAGSIRGCACEGLAAIDLLATFTRQRNYRKDEIKRVLIQSYWAIRYMQQKDGSFSYAQCKTTETYGFDNLAATEVAPNSNAVWTSWLRLIALATIDRRYPNDLPQIGEWRFRRWPVLGYHRTADTLSDHEREVLPIWIRPTSYSYSASSAMQTISELPAVSVIIPCYNLGRYLHEAVESVLAQTMQEFEVIIVDDGSTDEFTRMLLINLDRPKTRVIHQINRGVSAARNQGIRQARGRYICCLDADDRLRPEFFQKAFAILETQPDVGYVTTHFQIFDDRDGTHVYNIRAFPSLLAQNQAIISSLFRRDAWEKAGGYCETFSMQGIEDWDLWVSIQELGYRAAIIPEVLFEYRIRLDSAYHGTARRPENFGCLFGEMVRRHQKTYSQYIAEILAETGAQMALLSQWAEEREQAKRWWEEQSANWRQLASEREQAIREQQAWICELEKAKSWLDEQRCNWQRLADEREQVITQKTGQVAAFEKELSLWQSVIAQWQDNICVRLGLRLGILKQPSVIRREINQERNP